MADVIVTNTSREDFVGQHNGQVYNLPAGASAPVPEAAAKHLFGYLCDFEERVAVALRHGWHMRKNSNGEVVKLSREQMVKRLDPFDVVTAKLVADPAEEEAPTSLSPKAKKAAAQAE